MPSDLTPASVRVLLDGATKGPRVSWLSEQCGEVAACVGVVVEGRSMERLIGAMSTIGDARLAAAAPALAEALLTAWEDRGALDTACDAWLAVAAALAAERDALRAERDRLLALVDEARESPIEARPQAAPDEHAWGHGPRAICTRGPCYAVRGEPTETRACPVTLSDLHTLVSAECATLREEVADWQDAYRRVAAEECAPDERHCACVVHLRRELDEARALAADLDRQVEINEGLVLEGAAALRAAERAAVAEIAERLTRAPEAPDADR